MTGRTIAIETDTLATGDTLIVARVPPRMCGAPNLAAAERVRQLVAGVNPDAFDPVPEAVAQAIVRDACPYTSPPGSIGTTEAAPVMYALPPNCEGQPKVMRASFPPFDDDEGGPAEPARYPPGVACNVTGECE